MRCWQCNVDYPNYLLAPIGSNRENLDGFLCCGICYLFMSNRELGLSRTMLGGKDSEALRLKAIKYREFHKVYVHNPWEEFKDVRMDLIKWHNLEIKTEGYEILKRAQEYLWIMYGENP